MCVGGQSGGYYEGMSRDTFPYKRLGVMRGILDQIPENRWHKVSWGMFSGDMPISKGGRQGWAEEGQLLCKCS